MTVLALVQSLVPWLRPARQCSPPQQSSPMPAATLSPPPCLMTGDRQEGNVCRRWVSCSRSYYICNSNNSIAHILPVMSYHSASYVLAVSVQLKMLTPSSPQLKHNLQKLMLFLLMVMLIDRIVHHELSHSRKCYNKRVSCFWSLAHHYISPYLATFVLCFISIIQT